jgi:hypothetical protein
VALSNCLASQNNYIFHGTKYRVATTEKDTLVEIEKKITWKMYVSTEYINSPLFSHFCSTFLEVNMFRPVFRQHLARNTAHHFLAILWHLEHVKYMEKIVAILYFSHGKKAKNTKQFKIKFSKNNIYLKMQSIKNSLMELLF